MENLQQLQGLLQACLGRTSQSSCWGAIGVGGLKAHRAEKDHFISRTREKMPSSFSEPTESFLEVAAVLRLGGEELRAGGPYIDPALLCAPIDDSTLDAAVLEKQGRTTSDHGEDDSLPSSSRHSCIQSEPQPNLLSYEVSVARSPAIRIQTNVPQARAHETGGHVIIQPTQDCGSRNMNRRARTICTDCNRGFGRAQELARHRKDVHEQPRYCLFCGFKWTRPISIKTHLLARHRGKFNAELLATIQALRGRMIVAFLDGYDQDSGVEVEFHFPVPWTSTC
jgi:hypothetical protein